MRVFSRSENRPIGEIPTRNYGTLEVLSADAQALELRLGGADAASQFARAIRTAFRIEYRQGTKVLRITQAYGGSLDVPSLAEYINGWEL